MQCRAVSNSVKIKFNRILISQNGFQMVKIQFNLILAELLTALVWNLDEGGFEIEESEDGVSVIAPNVRARLNVHPKEAHSARRRPSRQALVERASVPPNSD